MARFHYIVKDAKAKTYKGIREASSKDELVRKLRQEGYFIITVAETTQEAQPQQDIGGRKHQFTHSKIKVEDLSSLARDLATLLDSGVTLLRSLEIISSQISSVKLNKVVKEITKNVKSGLSLRDSLAKYPHIFSTLWLGLVETGEASGNLPMVLNRLADYLELRLAFQRKIGSALVYPVILIFAATGAVTFFLTFILPKFTKIFAQFKINLPLPTRMLIAISNFLRGNVVLLTVLLIGLFFLLRYLKNTDAGALWWDKIKLQLPLLKNFFLVSALERFSSILYILLDSGVPIIFALEVSQHSVQNKLIEKYLSPIKENVRKGMPLSKELAKVAVFPPLVVEMARIGEEVGNQPKMFKKVSEHYQTELETAVERFVAAFEPVMIMVMAVVIGGIVISLFLPMFQLATLGGGGGM